MNCPIRVLCVFSTLDRGGAETMCMNLYRHIDREKIQFDFVKHTSETGDFEEEIKKLGGCIYEAPQYKIYNTVQYRKWWKDHLLKHPEHKIIHGHYFTISAIYFNVAKNMGRTTIGHAHASTISGTLKQYLCKQISKYSDYRFACSEQAGRWLYGDKPFCIVKNALDIDKFQYNEKVRQQYRDELNLNDYLILGTVANMSPVKNPMGVIDIFLEVHRRKENTKLVWVGEGGQRNTIEERIKQERIESYIILLGQRRDVNKILQAIDVFLLPSINEGLPVSVIEAQASGLPCYISDKITSEVDITGLCHFLPLDAWSQWAKEILTKREPRENTKQKIIGAGYDIHSTAIWLEEFYLRINKEQGGNN